MIRTMPFSSLPSAKTAEDFTMDDQPQMLKSDEAIAGDNHRRLLAARVFAVNVIGGPGCGKTELIIATVGRLILKRRIGIITADPFMQFDSDRVSQLGNRVIHVDPGHHRMLGAGTLQTALSRLVLPALDILLIENISSLIGPAEIDLGEDAKVCIFSVAAGDDKAAKFPDVVQSAKLVILNKTDLLSLMPFNTEAFESDVRRINPSVEFMKISTRSGEGLEAWLDWLLKHAPSKTATNL